MSFCVYLIITTDTSKKKSYVGYSKDLKKRIILHNSNKGAKSTKGYKWKVIFKKYFQSKSAAMSFEYKLKKNRKLRKKINKKKKII